MPMKNPPHPGRIVKGSMEELELSVTDTAKVLGVTRPTISKLINGHSSISPEMAIRLSKAFGSTPEFWLRLQLIEKKFKSHTITSSDSLAKPDLLYEFYVVSL